jgi:hypothetical protein
MQMLDGWTDVSTQSPGSRLGSREGNYALIGPDWKGEKSDLPAGVAGYDRDADELDVDHRAHLHQWDETGYR